MRERASTGRPARSAGGFDANQSDFVKRVRFRLTQEELTPDGPLISMVATKKGGYWAHRLGQRCHAYLGELGEEELYEVRKFFSQTH